MVQYFVNKTIGFRETDMSIVNAIMLFVILILVYWAIGEIFTVLFRFTGLPYDKARFQVLSLLTGTGFTTRESEGLISVRSRRKLAQVTMLFGYVFNITIISAFINIFVSLRTKKADNLLLELVIPLVVIIIVLAILRLKPVHRRMDALIEKLAGKVLNKEADNTILLVDYISHDSIAKVKLKEVPEELKGQTLRELDFMNKTGIVVMLIERGDQKIAPGGKTVFMEGDKVTLFGDYKTIMNIFHAKEWFN